MENSTAKGLGSNEIYRDIYYQLNQAGTYLEDKVHSLLHQRSDTFAQREFPYSVVNTTNRLVNTVLEGIVDIYAIARTFNDGPLVCMSIECKKVNPAQKRWVFERRKTGDEEYPFLIWDVDPKVAGINYGVRAIFPSLGYGHTDQYEKAIQGFPTNYKGGLDQDHGDRRIYDALKQANQPLSAFAGDPRTYVFNQLMVNAHTCIFLPIVVTTAPLLLLDYHSEDVDIHTGEVPGGKTKLVERPWLHYEFPLPISFQFDSSRGVAPRKRPSFIVNANSFTNFVDMVIADVPRYILPLIG
ncbi:MAG: hypothetical protein Q7S31_00415 [bacterium]|nr:hypothetical protein [bacterium]